MGTYGNDEQGMEGERTQKRKVTGWYSERTAERPIGSEFHGKVQHPGHGESTNTDHAGYGDDGGHPCHTEPTPLGGNENGCGTNYYTQRR